MNWSIMVIPVQLCWGLAFFVLVLVFRNLKLRYCRLQREFNCCKIPIEKLTLTHLVQNKLPRLWNTKCHWHFHKAITRVPIPKHVNPAHVIPPCLFKIYFNIILTTTMPHKLLRFFTLPHKISTCIFLFPQTFNMPYPTHIPQFY
jgi:hypothetical protein